MPVLFFAVPLCLIAIFPQDNAENSVAIPEKLKVFLTQAGNNSVAPCDDFYEHVCGNYDSEIHSLQKFLFEVLEAAIKEIDPKQKDIPSYKKTLKFTYDQCQSLKTDSQWLRSFYDSIATDEGRAQLQIHKIFDETESQPNLTTSWRLAGVLDRHFGFSLYGGFGMVSYHESWNISKYLGYACNSDGSLATDAEQLKVIWDEYGKLSSIDERNLTDSVKFALENLPALCSDLVNDTFVAQNAENDSFEYSPYLQKLRRLAPHFLWREFLRTTIYSQEYLEKIDDADIELEAVRPAYIGLEHVGRVFSRHSVRAVRSLAVLALLKSEMAKRDIDCVSQLQKDQLLRLGLLKLYLDKLNSSAEEYQKQVKAFSQSIISAFAHYLGTTKWLNDIEKEQMMSKLNESKFHLNLPQILDDANHTENLSRGFDESVSFLRNIFNSARRSHDQYVDKRVKEATYLWKEDSFPSLRAESVYNYDHLEWRVEFLIEFGATAEPRFNFDAFPSFLNYAGYGYNIAHLLMQAFDISNYFGRTLSPDFDSNETLTRSLQQKYEAQYGCINGQNAKYCEKSSGCKTPALSSASDRVLDIAGLKMAYNAYQTSKASESSGGVNDDKLFFTAVVRQWCASREYAPDSKQVVFEMHLLPKARINTMIRNFPKFREAFKCAKGSSMAPSEVCPVWGDM